MDAKIVIIWFETPTEKNTMSEMSSPVYNVVELEEFGYQIQNIGDIMDKK